MSRMADELSVKYETLLLHKDLLLSVFVVIKSSKRLHQGQQLEKNTLLPNFFLMDEGCLKFHAGSHLEQLVIDLMFDYFRKLRLYQINTTNQFSYSCSLNSSEQVKPSNISWSSDLRITLANEFPDTERYWSFCHTSGIGEQPT